MSEPQQDGGTVRASAPAKINLHLGVGAVRPDGYHPVCTVYQALGLRDEVTVRRAEQTTLRILDDQGEPVPGVPLDESNTVWRAARTLLLENGLHQPLEMEVRKRIPVSGGLAGGSADAAAALLAVDALLGLRTSGERLHALAATVGSDVPFALLGGTALGRGRGEQLDPVEAGGPLHWVVVESPTGLSTQRVYGELDDLRERGELPAADGEPATPDALLAALRHGDRDAVAAALDNDLQQPALRLRPDLAGSIEAACEADGVLAVQVSGSGPSLLLLTRDAAAAQELAARVSAQDARDAAPRPAHRRVFATVSPEAGARLEPDDDADGRAG